MNDLRYSYDNEKISFFTSKPPKPNRTLNMDAVIPFSSLSSLTNSIYNLSHDKYNNEEEKNKALKTTKNIINESINKHDGHIFNGLLNYNIDNQQYDYVVDFRVKRRIDNDNDNDSSQQAIKKIKVTDEVEVDRIQIKEEKIYSDKDKHSDDKILPKSLDKTEKENAKRIAKEEKDKAKEIKKKIAEEQKFNAKKEKEEAKELKKKMAEQQKILDKQKKQEEKEIKKKMAMEIKINAKKEKEEAKEIKKKMAEKEKLLAKQKKEQEKEIKKKKAEEMKLIERQNKIQEKLNKLEQNNVEQNE